jgi:hypothetical protein
MANLLDEASILLSATAYNNGSMLAVKPENGDGDMTFSRNSAATRVNAQGLVENVAINLPRIDYTDGCGSWLLEPQSTNLVPYSENFSQSNWIKQANVVLTPNQPSPDGGNNAYKVQGTIGSSYILDGGFGAITPQSRSIYMRADTNGVVYSLGDSQSNQINVTTEWQRFELQEVSNTIYAVDFRGSGVTLDTVYIWGAQLEENSYSTSLIPTQGGAISTRLRDIATNSGNASLINSEEGVLYAEIAALTNDLTNRFISISNGSKAERVEIGYSNVSNKIFAFSNVGNVNQCNISFVLPNMLDYNKIALKYKLNDFSLWVNGVKVGVDLNASVSAENILNELAFDEGDGTDVFYSKTKALAVYKTALTDEQLTLLTTI